MSVFISGHIDKSSPDIQTVFMNIKIVIPALYFFQISSSIQREIKCLMTVCQKSCKKKVVFPTVPIIKKEEDLYAKIHHPN